MTTLNSSKPREKLVATAIQQFEAYGYRGVGIDKIIQESGVAKATFYTHFPSKEALYTEALSTIHRQSMTFFQTFAESRENLFDRVLAPIDCLFLVLPEVGFRGCPFINMNADIYDLSSEARHVGREHYEQLQTMIATFANDLANSETSVYGHLAGNVFANQYLTIYTGAVALTALWQQPTPLHTARGLIIQLMRHIPGD